jgi:hypothetical protein
VIDVAPDGAAGHWGTGRLGQRLRQHLALVWPEVIVAGMYFAFLVKRVWPVTRS